MEPAATCTSGISRAIATASSQARLERPPAPSRTPPMVALPPQTISRLAPRDWICASTCRRAPSPTATVAITAATPIKIPSAVRMERSRLAESAESAPRSASSTSMPRLAAVVMGGRSAFMPLHPPQAVRRVRLRHWRRVAFHPQSIAHHESAARVRQSARHPDHASPSKCRHRRD